MSVGRRFKSCPADHVNPQVTRLNAVAFFVPCAKRVQKLRRENKKSAHDRSRERKEIINLYYPMMLQP